MADALDDLFEGGLPKGRKSMKFLKVDYVWCWSSWK